jgi:hypothetical protein
MMNQMADMPAEGCNVRSVTAAMPALMNRWAGIPAGPFTERAMAQGR